MNIELGLFMGACLYAAFRIGAYAEKRKFERVLNNMLSKMNSDMNGKVEEWFEKEIKRHA